MSQVRQLAVWPVYAHIRRLRRGTRRSTASLRAIWQGGEEEGDGSEGHGGIAEKNAGDGERIAFDPEVVGGEGEAGEAAGEERGAVQRGEARGASAEKHGEQDAEGDGIQLDEGVGPHFGLPGVVGGQIPAGEVGGDEHDGGGDEQVRAAERRRMVTGQKM